MQFSVLDPKVLEETLDKGEASLSRLDSWRMMIMIMTIMMTLKYGECAKIIGTALFKETNSYHYVKLLATPLFGELTEETVQGIPSVWEELTGRFRKEIEKFYIQELRSRHIFGSWKDCLGTSRLCY